MSENSGDQVKRVWQGSATAPNRVSIGFGETTHFSGGENEFKKLVTDFWANIETQKEEKLHNETPEQKNRRELLDDLYYNLITDKSFHIDTQQAKALFINWLDKSSPNDQREEIEGLWKSIDIDAVRAHTPKIENKKRQEQVLEQHYDMDRSTSEAFYGIIEYQFLLDGIRTIDPPHYREIVTMMSKGFLTYVDYIEDSSDYFRLLFAQKDAPEDLKIQVGADLVKYWSEGKLTYDDKFWLGLFTDYRSICKRSFLQHYEGNQSQIRNVLIDFIRQDGLPSTINTYRRMMEEGSDQEKKVSQEVVRDLLGLPADIEIFSALDKLYASIKFEEYKVNEASFSDRMSWLQTKLPEENKEQIRVIDVGCGTGEMVKALHDLGYVQTFGMDKSTRNIEAAKRHGLHSVTGKDEEVFAEANWFEMPYEDSSADYMLSLGRSLPHTEDQAHFEKVIDEFARVLKPDGTLIFDMPNPQVGKYLENVNAYRQFLMDNFGFKPEEAAKMHYLVDGPDAAHMYNRYVPPEIDILRILKAKGFELVTLEPEAIPNPDDPTKPIGENMQFVFKKISEQPKKRKKTPRSELKQMSKAA